MKLGVFDSGIGGETVAAALRQAFPEAEIVITNDRAHVPYGSRTAEEVIHLTDHAIQPLLETNCDVIVIACNTATTLALPSLRRTYPSQKFIGIEPMIKTASEQSVSGVICVCATPATLMSTRYDELKTRYADSRTVIEPDCSDWANMIEHNSLHSEHIQASLLPALAKGADVIVLGCTHYHWIKEDIQRIAAGRAVVLEPSEAIARRVTQLLTIQH